jgi:hypothetical protein
MGGVIMRMIRKLASTYLALMALPGAAQVTFDGCKDIRGIPVASVLTPGLNDVAKAGLGAGGAPVIWYNPDVLASASPQFRLWAYGHECGHHALGHNFGTTHPLRLEQDADCFATRTLVEKGLLDANDLAVVQRDVAAMGAGDWTHLPGPQRAINLRACLADGSHGQTSKRQVPCRHRIACTHTTACSHTAPCQHRMACQHYSPTPWGPRPMHPFDTLHPYDTAHPFDAAHPFDTAHPYDLE